MHDLNNGKAPRKLGTLTELNCTRQMRLLYSQMIGLVVDKPVRYGPRKPDQKWCGQGCDIEL